MRDNEGLICTKTDGITKYKFNNFMLRIKFALKIHNRNITLQEAEDDQLKLKLLINNLINGYNSRNKIKIKEQDNTLKSTKKLLVMRKEIINAFKKGILPYIDGFEVEKKNNR